MSLYAVSVWFLLNMASLKETWINTLSQNKINPPGSSQNVSERILKVCKDFWGIKVAWWINCFPFLLSYTSKLHFILSIKCSCHNLTPPENISLTQNQPIINKIRDSGDLNSFPTTTIRDLEGRNRTREGNISSAVTQWWEESLAPGLCFSPSLMNEWDPSFLCSNCILYCWRKNESEKPAAGESFAGLHSTEGFIMFWVFVVLIGY